jgi:hypothetical protein
LSLTVIFLFVFVGLFAKENIGGSSQRTSARIFGLALVRVELPLETSLRIDHPLQGVHWNLKFLAAKRTESDSRSGTQPFDDPKLAFDHGQIFLGRPAFSIDPSSAVGSWGSGHRFVFLRVVEGPLSEIR